VDSKIVSNSKKYNENVTVLEWLNNQGAYKGKVVAIGSWEVFPYIINDKRSEIPVNSGWQPIDVVRDPTIKKLINKVQDETPHYWDGVRFDAFTHFAVMEYLQSKNPKVLYVAYGETDDWAHDLNYEMYLNAAHRTDGYIREIWETIQALSAYAGKTSLVITTDHGRGSTDKDWSKHGSGVKGSEYTWIAVLGSDTQAKGVITGENVTQGQVAATVAALLGEDYHGAQSRSARPLPGVIEK
jgi:hypothetical protein